jgi:PDDEXK-like uncharacterized protein DUF3799
METQEPAPSGNGGALSEYDRIEAVNISTLKEMRRSPLHYAHRLRYRREDTDPMRIGRASHTLVFEPDVFFAQYVVWKGGRRYGKEWDAFEATALLEGKTVLTADQFADAVRIAEAVTEHELVKPYLAEGTAEKILTWTDKETGIACKCRIDWLSPTVVLDLKNARNATTPSLFASDAYRLGYFHQLSFYRRGVKAVRDYDPLPVLVAVESTQPHDVAIYLPTSDALYAADEEVGEWLKRLAKCRALSSWPGCFDKPLPLNMPRWAFPSVEDMGALDDPDWMK